MRPYRVHPNLLNGMEISSGEPGELATRSGFSFAPGIFAGTQVDPWNRQQDS